MIDNFSYVYKKITCRTPEDIMEASGNFIYAGTGTIEDTDYDKIYTFNGYDDGHTWQLEFYHLTSETSGMCCVRLLKDGSNYGTMTQSTYVYYSNSFGSDRPLYILQIKSGTDVILEFFVVDYHTGSSSFSGIGFSLAKYVEIYKPQASPFLSGCLGNSALRVFDGLPQASAPPPWGIETTIVARNAYIAEYTGVSSRTHAWWFNNSTSLYFIQTTDASVSPTTDQNCRFGAVNAVLSSWWAKIEIDGKLFMTIPTIYIPSGPGTSSMVAIRIS